MDVTENEGRVAVRFESVLNHLDAGIIDVCINYANLDSQRVAVVCVCVCGLPGLTRCVCSR